MSRHGPRSSGPLLKGQAVATFGRRLEISLDGGATLACVTRGKGALVACGDFVDVRETTAGQGVVEAIRPRSSLLHRSNALREKLLAANVSQAIFVLAPVPAFSEELLARCLVAATAAVIHTLIVLNKSDLQAEWSQARSQLDYYQALGYSILPLCARQSIAALLPFLDRHTSILVGQSGMGKSSIINALVPDAAARTAEISLALDSGRHTTTSSRLYCLGDAAKIIDSPGLQEFGLHHLSAGEIEYAFTEFRPYLGACRFNNCRHTREPDCALKTFARQSVATQRRLNFLTRVVAARG